MRVLTPWEPWRYVLRITDPELVAWFLDVDPGDSKLAELEASRG